MRGLCLVSLVLSLVLYGCAGSDNSHYQKSSSSETSKESSEPSDLEQGIDFSRDYSYEDGLIQTSEFGEGGSKHLDYVPETDDLIPLPFEGLVLDGEYDSQTGEAILELQFAGCNENHTFKLKVDVSCNKSLPAQCLGVLWHLEGNQQACEKLIVKSFRMNIENHPYDDEYYLQVGEIRFLVNPRKHEGSLKPLKVVIDEDKQIGCRDPANPDCVSCRVGEPSSSDCRVKFWSGGEYSDAKPWYNGARICGDQDKDLKACASCDKRTEESLRLLSAKPLATKEACESIEIGIDPCFAIGSKECFCQRYLSAYKKCSP